METTERTTPHLLRVLVVEDDETLARLIELTLKRLPAEVTVARTGRDGLSALAGDEFDALACDVGLPDMSGLDVIRKARELSPSIGIVAITGHVDVDVAVESMKAGGDDFLGKPFDPAILWALVQKAVDNRGQRVEAEQAALYKRLAYTDALTDCPNRRFLDEFMERRFEQARTEGKPLTVAYLDIDNFKLINDFMGHRQGDLVLKGLGAALRRTIDEPAVFGRFGGDEFLVIFPDMDEKAARVQVDRLKAAVTDIELINQAQNMLAMRLSCGYATLREHATPRDLVAEAEDEMYLHKSPTGGAGDDEGLLLPHTASIVRVSNLKALRNLVKAIDRRDSYTRYHSDHATNFALKMAHRLGLSEEDTNAIAIGGPVHDLGKIVVPDEILRKPGHLNGEERKQMEEHAMIGAAITAAVTDYDTVVELVRHHHERFDGKGYPGGLKGLETSLPARIFGLADAFSAMTTNRPYRKALSFEIAVSEIEKGTGTQFDPDLAPLFVDIVEREAIKKAKEQERWAA